MASQGPFRPAGPLPRVVRGTTDPPTVPRERRTVSHFHRHKSRSSSDTARHWPTSLRCERSILRIPSRSESSVRSKVSPHCLRPTTSPTLARVSLAPMTPRRSQTDRGVGWLPLQPVHRSGLNVRCAGAGRKKSRQRNDESFPHTFTSSSRTFVLISGGGRFIRHRCFDILSPNGSDQQIADRGLSTPQDSIAILLDGLVSRRRLAGTATRSCAAGPGPESHSGPVVGRMVDPDAAPSTLPPWPRRPAATTRTTYPRPIATADRATRRKPRGRMTGATRCSGCLR